MKRFLCMIIALLLTMHSAFAQETVDSPDALAFPQGFDINSDAFTGSVYLTPMIQTDETYNFPATNNVIFAPCARSSWHTHGGMIILGTGGVGYYQAENEPVQVIRPGDVVEIPEGVRHWHGAAPDSWFSQMVIYDSTYVSEESEEEPVTDEYYNSLQVDMPEASDSDGFMFEKAQQVFTSENFSKDAWVSNIIGSDNVAGAPGLHYVIFDEGCINNWHIHEGGQILIATDGVGYHQIEGEPVQVMHPGDVAFCPPGVKHWHGGSVDTQFAHIAVNTNPEKTGLEWFDRISEEEYALLASLEDVPTEDTVEAQDTPSDDTLVQTSAGMVRGTDLDGVYQYLGIPYAKATELFVPAMPVTPWEGVRDATKYGPISYQSGMFGMAVETAGENESNNAQNLNLWTPAIDEGNAPSWYGSTEAVSPPELPMRKISTAQT